MRKTLLGAAVLVLALPGCAADAGSPEPGPAAPTAPPPASAAPGGPSADPSAVAGATSGIGGAPAPAGALDGKRQVFFLPRLNDNELPDSVLAVTAAGRIQVTDDYADGALFVPVPKSRGAKERLIKTGALRGGGKPFCLQVSSNGAEPLTVVTAACDTAEPTQLFTFEATGQDGDGQPVYSVRNRDAFLQWHPLDGIGLVAEELGDSRLETTFTLLDQGAARLPKAG
ncbi:hypothetical protein [Actinoplanes sp. NPDC049599]|uniref:hypothetical protein n=1 Tax=Actinoplanes sp. NPDC049599 TaxID=3363903 RepID=UPI0037943E61